MTARLCPRCAAVGVEGHVTGPADSWDVGIGGLGAIIVAAALGRALWLLLRPGEKAPRHIKRAVLDDTTSAAEEGRP